MSSSATDNILSIYQRHVAAFARSRALFEKNWLDRFIAAIGGEGHILDIGCGNCQPIAGYFIAQGFQLTGVDGAAAMLNRAQAYFPEQSRIEQDMRALALGETFDGLVA